MDPMELAPKHPGLESKEEKKRDPLVPTVSALPGQKDKPIASTSTGLDVPLVLPQQYGDLLALMDEPGPSSDSVGTPWILGHMETFLTLEDVFLPYPAYPLLSGAAVLREVLSPEADPLPLS